jgi:hypothetical protein
MRGRGLKQILMLKYCQDYGVAPHAGAWIETFEICIFNLMLYVAPHAGAWIETIQV